MGNFSLFGIGGSSNIEFLSKDADEKDLFSAKDADSESISGFGVLGLKNSIGLSDNTNLKTIVSSSMTTDKYVEDRYYDLNTPEEAKLKYTDADNKESRIALNTTLNSKFSSSLFLRTGFLWEHFMNDAILLDSDKQPGDNGDGYPDINLIYSSKDNYDVLQNYAQIKYRFNDRLSINTGLHTQYFSLNEQFVLEPRLSGTWTLNTKNSLNFGYGIHHQNIAAPVLFLIDDLTDTQPNRNLDLIRSQHFALNYDLKLAEKWRAKIEVYYQLIDNAAVETTPSSYSSLTEGTDFGFSTDKPSLVSDGTGFNRGVEFTLEKFFSDGYHALMTTTLFESKFEGSDGVERNSPFNNKYIFNALGGKEFKIGATKKNIFSIDGKLTTMGGRFYTPVDLAASQAAGYEIKDDAIAYTKQYDPYFRLDVKFAMKLNHASKKQSHQFYIDFQNVTNKKNIFANTYNRLTNEVNRVNQLGFFPDFGYKFQL